MKRISGFLFILILVLSVPMSLASGQEKKNEQKIKVVVTDDSGTRTIIDTVFTGSTMPKTITLTDGKVLHISKEGIDLDELEEGSKGKRVMVTVSSDLDEGDKTESKVIVVSSDSTKWTVKPGQYKGHVYIYSSSESTGEKPAKHFYIASAGDKLIDLEGEKGVVISKVMTDGGKSIGIYITDNEESETGVTKFVLAKNGVVVTIESDDEAKAKEIMKEIESRLDAKADTKKTEKK